MAIHGRRELLSSLFCCTYVVGARVHAAAEDHQLVAQRHHRKAVARRRPPQLDKGRRMGGAVGRRLVVVDGLGVLSPGPVVSGALVGVVGVGRWYEVRLRVREQLAPPPALRVEEVHVVEGAPADRRPPTANVDLEISLSV